jgi:hypothetical protein
MLAEDLSHREDTGAALLRRTRAPANVTERPRTVVESIDEGRVGDDFAVAHDHVVRVASPTVTPSR